MRQACVNELSSRHFSNGCLEIFLAGWKVITSALCFRWRERVRVEERVTERVRDREKEREIKRNKGRVTERERLIYVREGERERERETKVDLRVKALHFNFK